MQPLVDLSGANTLNLPCIAKNYIELNGEADLLEVFNEYPLMASNYLMLGGGSNVILPSTIDHFVLSFKKNPPALGSHVIQESQTDALIEVDAGVDWDAFVEFSVQSGFSGLENLSLIPGTVGAAPIQNIGAYGVEVSDCLEWVKVFNAPEKAVQVFKSPDCQFAYRDSIFKRHPGQFVIISVCFKLAKQASFILDYGELSSLKGLDQLSSHMVRQKVIETRQAKLPDPKVLPNAGSFFKNPVVSATQLNELKCTFPNIINYPLETGTFKLAAAWLIDQAGWKGFRNERVGVHDKQALVIVNHNQGVQADILTLAQDIQTSVFRMFNVTLEIEPVLIKHQV